MNIAIEFLIFAQELETGIGKWNPDREEYETNYTLEDKEYNEEDLWYEFLKLRT